MTTLSASVLRRARRSAVAAAVVAVLAMVSPGAAAAVSPSSAQHPPTYTGQDYGWPDCAKSAGGQGQPLPPPTWYRLLVVEVNARFVMDENPCLARELAYAKSHANVVGDYHLPDYPTPAQIAQSGYWPLKCGTANLDCRTYNSGFQQGQWAVNLLRSKGSAPRFLWVDVEHRAEQDYSTNIPSNVALIRGELQGIRSLGVQVGIYSYAYGWREITGNWQIDLPLWVTIGHSSSGAARVARCSSPGFTSGPVVMVQSTSGAYDSDTVCPGYASYMQELFTPNVALPGS